MPLADGGQRLSDLSSHDPAALADPASHLTLEPLRFVDRGTFLELVTKEIGPRYPETGERYAIDLWSAHSGHAHEQFGASTRSKVILGLYRRKRLLGFTVATEKDGLRVKFGPSIVLPTYRNSQYAVLMRIAAEDIFRKRGSVLGYSTCQEINAPARRYVMRAGYRLAAALRDQYTAGRTELVYTKQLGDAWADINCSSSMRVVAKRGGGMQLHIPSSVPLEDGGTPEHFLENILLVSRLRRAARKIYAWTPAHSWLAVLAPRFGFVREAQHDRGPAVPPLWLLSRVIS